MDKPLLVWAIATVVAIVLESVAAIICLIAS